MFVLELSDFSFNSVSIMTCVGSSGVTYMSKKEQGVLPSQLQL